MRVAIIGATGKAGSLIAAECMNRGVQVTGIVRPRSLDRLPEGCEALPKDLFDLTTEDLEGFDAVVDAFGTASYGRGKEELHVSSMEHLIRIMEPIPSVRLLVVGGAGSLYTDGTKTRKVVEDIPEAFRAVPENMAAAFEKLKASKVNWTYFSPAASFRPDGERTGRYILGRDIKILNNFGESMISYADYALAMADEIAEPRFIGKRFTAVSDTSFSENPAGKDLFNMAGGMPFTRMGAYFGIFINHGALRRSSMDYQSARLYIGSRRGDTPDPPNSGNELLRIYPTYQGEKLGYAIHTTAAELTLTTAYGKIRICFADEHLMMIRGERGLGLKLEKNLPPHDTMRQRAGKAWEANFRRRCSLVLNPLKGDIDMKADWEWETFSTPLVRAQVIPDTDGEFLLAIDESLYSGMLRESYPTYEEALTAVTADWEAFLETIPHFDEELEPLREEAAWTLWSFIISPSGRVKRSIIFMTGRAIASSWQMCQNAAALQYNLPIATDLLLNMLDEQSEDGQLPDFYDESKDLGQGIKPPVQGWVLKWMMKNHDLKQELPEETLARLYEGYLRWAEWFMTVRNLDGDDLPIYDHGDESGTDDSSMFLKASQLKTADLAAFLAVLYEALGDLAGMLGREEEAGRHYARSKAIISRLIETFWNGSKFIALTAYGHETVDSDSLQHYLPIVLGKRLPQEIIDKMTADLMKEGDFLTPYGLASEKLESSQFRVSGMSRGFLIPPQQLFLLTGLYDAGKVEEAKEIARRYCLAMKESGFSLLIDPTAGGRGSFACSWPACTFIVLADMICNM